MTAAYAVSENKQGFIVFLAVNIALKGVLARFKAYVCSRVVRLIVVVSVVCGVLGIFPSRKIFFKENVGDYLCSCHHAYQKSYNYDKDYFLDIGFSFVLFYAVVMGKLSEALR